MLATLTADVHLAFSGKTMAMKRSKEMAVKVRTLAVTDVTSGFLKKQNSSKCRICKHKQQKD